MNHFKELATKVIHLLILSEICVAEKKEVQVNKIKIAPFFLSTKILFIQINCIFNT